MKYPTAIKAKMIKKMTGPRAMSAVALSRESGIPQPTLSRWLRAAATVKTVSRRDKKNTETPSKRPEDWSMVDKLAAIIEAHELGPERLGEFLRKRGLHAEQLELWKTQIGEAMSKKRRRGRSAEQKRIRQLERELARKEKALAEAAALLVLKKKLETFYGEDEDDDTGEGNDR